MMIFNRMPPLQGTDLNQAYSAATISDPVLPDPPPKPATGLLVVLFGGHMTHIRVIVV